MKKTILNILLLGAMMPVWADDYKPIVLGRDGLEINADSKGNRTLDFSQCGYRQSDVAIPEAKVVAYVSHAEGDQWARIQRAIDFVSTQKPDKQTGLRGAVLLGEGEYMISKPLRIAASGVVLRGTSKTGTVIRKTGVDRGAIIYIEGKNDCVMKDTMKVTADYVPVNSRSFTVSGKSVLNAGDDIVIVRPSTKEWIASIGCDVFGGGLGYWGWKPGEMDVRWSRRVVETKGNTLTVDVPLTVALDKKWGEAYLVKYSWPGRISDCGVENITLLADSNSDNAMNEDHAWEGVYIDNAMDCWVRMTDFKGLAGSAVIVHRGAQQVTVEDCISSEPRSEVGGMRRRTFLTMGGKCLFQRCLSIDGINDFSAGYCAPGPNAFVQCDATVTDVDTNPLLSPGELRFSGSSSSWATGLLFDNVNIEGGNISFKNLELDKWGAGWNTANSLLWQCTASEIDCYNVSDDARSAAVGCWAYCQGTGFWSGTNDHVSPRSFFQNQLKERIGENSDVDSRCRVLMRSTDASSSPTVDKAQVMAREALKPRMTMEKWIAMAEFKPSVDPVSAVAEKVWSKETARQESKSVASVSINDNGVICLGTEAVIGTFHRTPWWNGRTRYPYMDKADYAVTRFVPGMEQRGGTDRIDSIITNINRQHVAVWNQNYGLWYDRRRDDHERIKRTTGDVWAPFFEQALARSGKGKAWDGLSKYDLTKLNAWYVSRIGQLAEARPQMLIINQHFFQHNILEAGAHWVDCPWRSANNLQKTDFLEPVPFTGDKRIFTAELFYDVTNPNRAQLYKQYIWNMLDEFAENKNVYHSISEEFTGPQHFVEFWLNCIAEWETKRGKKANVILNATFDVTQAVLAQPRLKDVVDVVEIEQWSYFQGGQEFKPAGGKNLAPRQHMRVQRNGHPEFKDVYRAVSEIRMAHPTKPVLYYSKGFDRFPWAVTFAGGSCPVLNLTNAEMQRVIATMRPMGEKDGVYRMESDKNGKMVYNTTNKSIDLSAEGKSKAYVVNQKDGSVTPLKSADIPANTIVWIK